jgi:hypothetical protein
VQKCVRTELPGVVLRETLDAFSYMRITPGSRHRPNKDIQSPWPTSYSRSVKMPINASTIPALDQVASQLLLALYRLKQRFEIAGSETREVISLYNLDENRRTIHQVLISFVSVHPSARHWLVVTLVKSCRRYPPSSKSIRISRLFSVSKSSFRTMPCFFSLNLIFS